jgi:Flp pilus assembly pilin Flp
MRGRDLRDDRGATSVEYAIMAVLIAAAIVGLVAAVGSEVADLFQLVIEAMREALS